MGCQLMARAFKRSRPRLAAVAWAVDAAGILQAVTEHQPQVAVISANLQDGPLTGFEVVRELHASHPKMHCVMLLDNSERDLITDAFRAGAHGVFCRDDSFEALCKCIHVVHQGQIWANSQEMHFVLEALAEAIPLRIKNGSGANLLTKREEAVVQLVAESLTNREISHQLNLSEHTVRNYLFRVFEKLGVSSRVELVLYYLHLKDRAQKAVAK